MSRPKPALPEIPLVTGLLVEFREQQYRVRPAEEGDRKGAIVVIEVMDEATGWYPIGWRYYGPHGLLQAGEYSIYASVVSVLFDLYDRATSPMQ